MGYITFLIFVGCVEFFISMGYIKFFILMSCIKGTPWDETFLMLSILKN